VSSLSYEPIHARRARRLVPETGLQAVIWTVVVVAVLAPIVPLVYASVQSKAIYLPGRTFTLDAYRQLFADPLFWTSVVNTLEFAALTTGFSVALGAGAAVLCGRTDVLGRRVYSRLFIAPILLPPLGVIIGWNDLYGPGGYAHDFINNTLHIPFDLTTVPGMAVLGTAIAVPVVFLVCQAALAGADSSLEDVARSVGASPLRVLARVTVPMLRPALLNSGLLVFTLAIETLGIPLLLGSANGNDFVASYLYNTWSNAITPDPPIVSAGATVLLVVACLMLVLRSRLLGDEARFVSIGGRGAGRGGIELGRAARIILGLLLALYLAVTTFAPIAALALSSVVSQLTPLIAPWHLLTLENWRAIGQGPFATSIRNTIEIAVIGAVVTTAVVALATAVAHRSKFRLRASLPFALLFPRAIPGIIIGIGFFWTFSARQSSGQHDPQQPLGHHAGAQHPFADARLPRHVLGLLDGQRFARQRGAVSRRELVDDDDPSHLPDSPARAPRVLHPPVRLHPERLRSRAVPRDAGPRDHGRTDDRGRAAGHDGAGCRHGHGAGRNHDRRDRRRWTPVRDQIHGTQICLRSRSAD